MLIKGTIAGWGSSKAVLILGTQGLVQLVTCATVERDVLRALERKGLIGPHRPETVRLFRLLRLDVRPDPPEEAIQAARPLLLPAVRHNADVAVLVAAQSAGTDWVLSENERHFNTTVAGATGLRIATPRAFLASIVLPVREANQPP